MFSFSNIKLIYLPNYTLNINHKKMQASTIHSKGTCSKNLLT